MSKLLLFLIISCSLGLLVSCAKPNPNPHAGDYIYNEFKGELTIAETKLTEKTKERDDFLEKMKSHLVTDLEKKSLRYKADRATKEMRRYDQQIKYWKLKLLSREQSVRQSYLDAFNQGQTWDNNEEIERYKKAIARLRKSRHTASAPAKNTETEEKAPSNNAEAEE